MDTLWQRSCFYATTWICDSRALILGVLAWEKIPVLIHLPCLWVWRILQTFLAIRVPCCKWSMIQEGRNRCCTEVPELSGGLKFRPSFFSSNAAHWRQWPISLLISTFIISDSYGVESDQWFPEYCNGPWELSIRLYQLMDLPLNIYSSDLDNKGSSYDSGNHSPY